MWMLRVQLTWWFVERGGMVGDERMIGTSQAGIGHR